MEGREIVVSGNLCSMTAGYFMTKLRYFVWNMFHMLVQECLRFLISKAVLVCY